MGFQKQRNIACGQLASAGDKSGGSLHVSSFLSYMSKDNAISLALHSALGHLHN